MTHAAVTRAARDAVFVLETLDVLAGLGIVFAELLDDILADITVVLFHLGCNFQVLLGRNIGRLSTLTQQVQHELCNITASNGDVLDGTTDNIAFGARNDVCDTITRVNDCSCEGAICDTVGRP